MAKQVILGCFWWSGESRWKVTAWQTSETSDSWEFWFSHCFCQLLKSSSSRSGCHPWSIAPPAPTGKYLAASKGPLAPAASAVRFSTGRSTGGFYFMLSKYFCTLSACDLKLVELTSGLWLLNRILSFNNSIVAWDWLTDPKICVLPEDIGCYRLKLYLQVSYTSVFWFF